MGLIWLGILLILAGILLSVVLPVAGAIVYVGWIVLAIGVVLAILHFIVRPRAGAPRTPPP